MTYEEKKTEWTNPVYREMVKYTCGSVCYNCGSTEGIEYHHIVPLKLGGTNNISNIACLCSRCHKAIHWGGHVQDYRNTIRTGRPHKADDQTLEKAISLYISGRIGTKECKSMMNMAESTKIGDMSYYKKYLKKRGIKKVKNNIDIISKKRGFLLDGDIVGMIEYENGEIKVTRYENSKN